LSSPAIYEKWFGEKHPDPQRLGNVPYGLPELFSDSIRESQLVANPGCHATTVILPLAPLLKEKLVSPEDIVIDCKSGISVDGRALKMSNMYCESNETVTAYSVGSCRHQPEIVDILHRYSNTEVQVSFTPHWVPMGRGIFSTIYLKSTHGTTPNQIRECLNSYYSATPFVRVVSHLPSTRYVSNSNYIDIAVRENGPRIVLFSAMDNLVKGAAGAAQQNMNCMFGLEPTLGLLG
jgi:N-acetyl-gamma-glutamyl-phosphate reductase